MAKHQIVTLLTDFGTEGPYVGAMKGVILAACPRATIVDLSHDVPAHDLLAASLVLWQAATHFPPETLHVVVVDPGVGTDRRILAGEFGPHRYLFPDNGVITFVARRAPLRGLASFRKTDLLPRRNVSATFHGRDVFAPLAGMILNGLKLSQLGPTPDSYSLLDVPEPAEREGAMVGQVIYVDRFGNLVTNLPAAAIGQRWQDVSRCVVYSGGRDLGAVRATYGHVGAGELLALVNSMGLLEIAANQARACDLLNAGVGAEVRVVGPAVV